MKFRRIIKNAILLLVVFLFILSFFTLSPQWCLSKERMWRAEEMDMVLYVDDEYETKFYECFGLSDRNELKEHIKVNANQSLLLDKLIIELSRGDIDG